MTIFLKLFALSLLATMTFAQGGGTVTGTVSDSTGALIPGAAITLSNPAVGSKFDTVTTATGNYTVPGIPVGQYTLTAEHPGFNQYVQPNIDVRLAVSTRVDAVMKIGATTDSVEVRAESTLLKTENAEQEMTLSGKQIAELPINFGIGAGAVRNPLSFIQMTPGATFNGWNNITINGSSNNFKIMFEGQEMDSAYQNQVSDEEQPSVEAIEQFTLQTSNFSAEYGLIGNGGLYNFTSKSGTNQFHGSAYEYFANSFLNAAQPWSPIPSAPNAGDPNARQKTIRHQDDYGFSIGGPVWIPKVYNGRNKTFFFFNLEKFRDRESAVLNPITVPNNEYRTGNLSDDLLQTTPIDRVLGTDFAGRPIIQNSIYDPASSTTDAQGRIVRQVFPNNIIPQSRIDPVAIKILGYIPMPNMGTADAYVNNYARNSGGYFKLQEIPSIKIDQVIGTRFKLSGYFGIEHTDKSNAPDGFLAPITQVRDQYIRAKTVRVNLDETVTPTLLFHLGVGFERHRNPDTNIPGTSGFDISSLGITGSPGTGFPRLGGIGDSVLGGFTASIGPNKRTLLIDQKPVADPTITWVHGNHTIKGGANWKLDTFTIQDLTATSPSYSFSGSETSQPLYGQTLPNGTGVGSAWASFLLGQYDSVSAGNGSDTGYRRTSWGLYLQDTWKLTRKLTLDYGLRWDFQQVLHEEHDRYQVFDPTLPNPNANGRLGATIYAGSGAGRCNCSVAPSYPYAIGPRIGLAYQLNGKTVIRAGWGVSYGQLTSTGTYPGSGGTGTGNTQTITSPGNNIAAGILSQPLPFNPSVLYGASYDPGANVIVGGGLQGSPSYVDPNWGRPSRTGQWNISLQREVMKDVVVEAAYVGNKAAWLQNGALVDYNAINPAVLAKYNLTDFTNSSVTTLLNSTITSPLAVAAGFTKPYANFPNTQTVLQSLRPFPQFSSINVLGADLGDSWYDALQVKVTKRFSYGLVGNLSYAYAKTEDSTSNVGNIYDRHSFKGLASTDIPNILSLNLDYTIPTFGVLRSNKFLNAALGGWRLGNIDTWQSGALLGTPTSSTNYASFTHVGYTRQVRVPGQPLYLIDVNCGCIDPTKQVVLNPAAWQNQTTGQASNVTYYNDFRGQRRPVVSGSLGKSFTIRERMSLNIRAEFFNLLNQNLSRGDPSTRSPQNPVTMSNGLLTGGFGTESYTNVSGALSSGTGPRTGQLVARFQF